MKHELFFFLPLLVAFSLAHLVSSYVLHHSLGFQREEWTITFIFQHLSFCTFSGCTIKKVHLCASFFVYKVLL